MHDPYNYTRRKRAQVKDSNGIHVTGQGHVSLFFLRWLLRSSMYAAKQMYAIPSRFHVDSRQWHQSLARPNCIDSVWSMNTN